MKGKKRLNTADKKLKTWLKQGGREGANRKAEALYYLHVIKG